ncbi:MAG: EamA family transporter [Kiritimatiellae bacterium]|nr:EamA family transporter [Kiritimatiellia bacterium]
MWLGWILASCVVLSLYDLSKKASVRGNAVFPTLLGSTLAGWLAVTAFLVCRGAFAATLALPWPHVLRMLFKSCIVGASWTATYMALRTLPITCAAPIRATGPLWTLLGAVVLFAEVPTSVQAVGMALVVAGCVAFSRSAAHEGIDFRQNRAVLLAFLGTVLGSCSALYDKHLLRGLGIPSETVLWWFLGGMCLIYAAAVLVERFAARSRARAAFDWRWTIPLVGILLAVSDACYFNAIATPGARISVLSMIRRSSVVVTFFLGGAVFHETNLRRKALALAAILAGVAALCLAK